MDSTEHQATKVLPTSLVGGLGESDLFCSGKETKTETQREWERKWEREREREQTQPLVTVTMLSWKQHYNSTRWIQTGLKWTQRNTKPTSYQQESGQWPWESDSPRPAKRADPQAWRETCPGWGGCQRTSPGWHQSLPSRTLPDKIKHTWLQLLRRYI